MYVTPQQLADGSDSLKELSELLDVPADLLRATLDEADRTGWDAGEIAAADAAVATIEQQCVAASGEIDARLVQRGYQVPLDAGQFQILAVWGRSIARYRLHPQRDRTSEETGRIERDYNAAVRDLNAVAKGELSLGAGDPLVVNQVTDNAGAVRVQSGDRKFSRRSLGSL
ncbi:MAG TPA: phage protein Gp36 family protein [Polyangiaceae bacterium]